MLAAAATGEQADEPALAEATERAVGEVVARQRDVGIDIANDGEQGRESFFTYVQHRMTGFGPGDGTPRAWKDMTDFPDYVETMRDRRPRSTLVNLRRPPQAIGPVGYGDPTAVERDAERLRTTAATASAEMPFVDTFLTAPSPGIIVAGMANRHYDSEEAYLAAVGDALAVEYRAIIEAGHLLQLDAPDLAMERHSLYANRSTEEFLAFAERVVATINRAIDGLPADRIRLHVCWGNYEGPHTHDIALAEVLPLLYTADVGGLLVSGGNPRHEHEYREFERRPLPDSWTLAAGVIDTTTNYVEHPNVVADRLERVAGAVGDPARVLACTDCGFDTAAGSGAVAADVAWAKLGALSEGAAIASERLF